MLCAVVGFSVFLHKQNLQTSDKNEAHLNLRPAPSFELLDVKGNKYSLSNFQGTLTVIHFWASWCPPCLDEIHQWIELATLFKDQRVKFLAISLDQNWKDAEKILPSSNLPSHVVSLLDPSLKIPEAYGTFQYPETYLINSELKIVSKWVGPQNWLSPEVQDQIKSHIH